MNDRDFKLLVRRYFQELSRSRHTASNEVYLAALANMTVAENSILSELEAFTKRDVEELPFGE
jgi:hypothetical protein